MSKVNFCNLNLFNNFGIENSCLYYLSTYDFFDANNPGIK